MHIRKKAYVYIYIYIVYLPELAYGPRVQRLGVNEIARDACIAALCERWAFDVFSELSDSLFTQATRA